MASPSAPDFETVYFDVRRRCLPYLGRWSRDAHAAEDALQDAWLAAWIAVDRGAPWPDGDEVRRVAMRVASRSKRRRLRERGIEDALLSVEDPNHPLVRSCDGEPSSREQLWMTVRDALGAVPEPERAAFLNFYYKNLKACALAEEAGVSRAAMLSRLRRTKLRLRKLVEARLRAGQSKTSQPDLKHGSQASGSPDRRAPRGVKR